MNISITQLQAYLRANARQHYEVVAFPPFTAFFHPTDSLLYFNYAIPDEPVGDLADGLLEKLHELFATRKRQLRFEFLTEFAPQLGDILRNAGLTRQAQQQFMICTPETYCPAPAVPGLDIEVLDSRAPVATAQEFCFTQRCGFNPADQEPATVEEAERFLRELKGGRAFLARLEGWTTSAGMFPPPIDGITELTGVSTLLPYRRRGTATALTACAIQAAFELGVRTICLTAEDEKAGRVYERVGFKSVATMLAYAVL